MVDYRTEFHRDEFIFNILMSYPNIMYLKIYVDERDSELKIIYQEAAEKHNNKMENNSQFIDAGFDLYLPSNYNETSHTYDNELVFKNDGNVKNVDFKIKCSAKMYSLPDREHNTGYYMFPMSSISKGRLRLANSVGIIDAGYRENLMSTFDLTTNISEDYIVNKYDRLMQICAPSLVPIIVEIVDTLDDLG
jgi:dUTPase